MIASHRFESRFRGQRMAVEINGFCDERFLPLKDAFRANFENGLEVGASFAVTHRGKPVVDSWAGHADWNRTRVWEKDTIVLLYSTSKIPLIMSFLLLVDRGLVDLDVPVATYWPEFAAGGKSHVTVRDALTHRAGVPGFEPPVPFEALHDWDGITAHIAAEAHWFDSESVLCYHAITYGFVLGEIIRRVSGRGPSQFFREEIADKAGIDLQLGLRSQAERARLAQNGYLNPPGGMMTRHPLARRVTESVGQGDWTTWENQRSDVPASNGYGNARAVARLCTIGAMGGVLDGVHYLSQKTVDEASREQVFAEEPHVGWLRLGLGFGLHSDGFPAPTSTCFHWGGYGGSFGIMDQATGIGCGYAMNNLIVPEQDIAEEPRYWRMSKALGSVMAGL